MLGIALRGVRWEEGFERAQAMLGMVPYPDAHPLPRYGWNAFSIHYYSSALLLWWTESPLVVCGLRNLLCVWGALLPVYMMASLLARSTMAGHLAALLLLANAQAFFRSYYANNVWPAMFTSGELGLAWAIGCVVALAAGRWRLAFFLVGLMPIIHIGQMPPVLALAVGCLAGVYCYRRSETWPALQGLAAGLSLTGAFLLIYWQFRQPLPPLPAGISENEVLDTWRRFTYFDDIHRRPTVPPRFGPFIHSHLALVGSLLLGAAWLRARWGQANERVAAMVPLAYVALCAAAVWMAWLIQHQMGINTPYLVIGWMPYRLSNHAAVILVCTVAAILCAPQARQVPPLAVGAALLWLALRPLLGLIVPPDVFDAYFSLSEGPLFLLLGAAAMRLWQVMPHSRWAWGLGFLSTLAFLLLIGHQFLVACMVLGAGIEVLAQHAALRQLPSLRPAMAVLGILAVLGLLRAEFQQRQHLPRTPFELEMRTYFQAQNDPKGMLLAPFWTINYQEKTGQPVFSTYDTPWMIPYLQPLGPSIEQMLDDAYGIRFGDSWGYGLEAWQARSTEGWQDLGQRYGIRYVLSPENVPIALDKVLEGEGWALHRIPAADRH